MIINNFSPHLRSNPSLTAKFSLQKLYSPCLLSFLTRLMRGSRQMSRHFKYPKYTYIKDNTYYFFRSVPVDLRCFYTKPRIIQSLRTNSLTRAKTVSKVFASTLDHYWLGLRLKTLEVYFAVKGVGRPKLFFTTAQPHNVTSAISLSALVTDQ